MKKPSECCTDVEGECACRNNYFDGKRLTTDSFRVEQRYLLQRRRLLNRIHGWGVVSGFGVTADAGKLTVKPGLALDECGRELLQSGTRSLTIDDIIVVDGQGAGSNHARFGVGGGDSTPTGCGLLSAHYAEQSSGPVTVKDGCSCEREEWERTCETVRYSVRPIDCNDCCTADECELECNCTTGPCCSEDGPRKRGGCRCLCDHLTNLPDVDCCTPLTEVDEPCGSVRVDLDHGVPLACVELTRDAAGRWMLGSVRDACDPRRLVKRNDLLFDLIQGCDLTRISDYGWKEWHRLPRSQPVGFDRFAKAFESGAQPGFWVEFSRPVRRSSLGPDCFAFTAMSVDRRSGWWQVFRVPIVGVDTVGDGDPPDCVHRATIVVDERWLKDEVHGATSLFSGTPTYIEIEVRGDFIVDCNGQTVDANAIGMSKPLTGNGTPGGTFLSTFWVAAAPNVDSTGAQS